MGLVLNSNDAHLAIGFVLWRDFCHEHMCHVVAKLFFSIRRFNPRKYYIVEVAYEYNHTMCNMCTRK